MRNGSGDVIGIRLRCPRTGNKWAVKGSAAGLFYSSDLLNVERPKRLWIVEGPTDTAAMLSLGFDTVGVPSAGGGADLLIDLARRILPREIVIIADHDENKAGIRGAERLADALLIIAPVRIVTPPNGLKDARAWVCSGASRVAFESTADVVSVRTIVMEGE
jgi:DNA primase